MLHVYIPHVYYNLQNIFFTFASKASSLSLSRRNSSIAPPYRLTLSYACEPFETRLLVLRFREHPSDRIRIAVDRFWRAASRYTTIFALTATFAPAIWRGGDGYRPLVARSIPSVLSSSPRVSPLSDDGG